jgi:hypothetical protein
MLPQANAAAALPKNAFLRSFTIASNHWMAANIFLNRTSV